MSDQMNPVVELEKTIFEVEISNFSDVFKKSQPSKCIESSNFEVKVRHQITKWQLQLYLKGKQEKYSKTMCLYLKCLSDIDAYIKASFSIVNSENEAVKHKILPHFLYRKNYNFGQFIKHKELFRNKKTLPMHWQKASSLIIIRC